MHRQGRPSNNAQWRLALMPKALRRYSWTCFISELGEHEINIKTFDAAQGRCNLFGYGAGKAQATALQNDLAQRTWLYDLGIFDCMNSDQDTMQRDNAWETVSRAHAKVLKDPTNAEGLHPRRGLCAGKAAKVASNSLHTRQPPVASLQETLDVTHELEDFPLNHQIKRLPL